MPAVHLESPGGRRNRVMGDGVGGNLQEPFTRHDEHSRGKPTGTRPRDLPAGKSTRQDPNDAVSWAELTLAYDDKGSFMSVPELSQEAVDVERRAVRLNPKLTGAYRWLGEPF